MTRLTAYLAMFLTLQINCNGQNFFNLTDSIFEVGQLNRIEITYQLSGGGLPTIESHPVLDSIVNFLNKNKKLKIKVCAHTDYRGDSTLNAQSSEIRASCVIDYLIEKGINTNRLEHKGYGEYNPIIVDSRINERYPFLVIGQKLTEGYIKKLETTEKQEVANKLNRRTEIEITEIKKRHN